MRSASFAIWTICCLLLMATIGGAAEPAKPPAAEDVNYVKGFILRGMLKQMIGSFNSPGFPVVGDTFEIDLANLPKDKFSFTTTNSETRTGPRPAYVAFPGSLQIDHVEKRTINHGASLFRLSANDASSKFIIQVRAPELVDGCTATIFLLQESFGRILCMAEAVGVLIERPVAAVSAPAANGLVLQYPKKEHFSATQLYQMGHPADAINKSIGQLVLLDVVVKIERSVALVEIEIPQEIAKGSNPRHHAIQAHLVSVTTLPAGFKQGSRHRIEGVIVDEGFDAYMIYLCASQALK